MRRRVLAHGGARPSAAAGGVMRRSPSAAQVTQRLPWQPAIGNHDLIDQGDGPAGKRTVLAQYRCVCERLGGRERDALRRTMPLRAHTPHTQPLPTPPFWPPQHAQPRAPGPHQGASVALLPRAGLRRQRLLQVCGEQFDAAAAIDDALMVPPPSPLVSPTRLPHSSPPLPRLPARQVDRTTAPWLIVTTHAPMYTSVGRHYIGGEWWQHGGREGGVLVGWERGGLPRPPLCACCPCP